MAPLVPFHGYSAITSVKRYFRSQPYAVVGGNLYIADTFHSRPRLRVILTSSFTRNIVRPTAAVPVAWRTFAVGAGNFLSLQQGMLSETVPDAA